MGWHLSIITIKEFLRYCVCVILYNKWSIWYKITKNNTKYMYFFDFKSACHQWSFIILCTCAQVVEVQRCIMVMFYCYVIAYFLLTVLQIRWPFSNRQILISMSINTTDSGYCHRMFSNTKILIKKIDQYWVIDTQDYLCNSQDYDALSFYVEFGVIILIWHNLRTCKPVLFVPELRPPQSWLRPVFIGHGCWYWFCGVHSIMCILLNHV